MKLPEPGSEGEFVIHAHRARRFHWDLRLEVPADESDFENLDFETYRKLGVEIKSRRTVMWSFAVPKAKIPEKGEKILLVETEIHPVEYNSFEGTIPSEMYGAGEVRIHDRGKVIWHRVEPTKIRFSLIGEKISGDFVIVRFKGDEKKWLWSRAEQGS